MCSHLKSKAGMTLIEMMAVIAVVAILVSIAMPMFIGETNKAAAATNAANLRSIEGKIATLKAMEPEAFEDFLELGQSAEDFGETELGGWLGNVFGSAESVQVITAVNGVLTVLPSNIAGGYDITNVPVSEETEISGEYGVADGVQMSVIITNNEITAFYDRYTREDFADIAEDGEYNGDNVPRPCSCENGNVSSSTGMCTCGHSANQHDFELGCNGNGVYGKCNAVD